VGKGLPEKNYEVVKGEFRIILKGQLLVSMEYIWGGVGVNYVRTSLH